MKRTIAVVLHAVFLSTAAPAFTEGRAGTYLVTEVAADGSIRKRIPAGAIGLADEV